MTVGDFFSSPDAVLGTAFLGIFGLGFTIGAALENVLSSLIDVFGYFYEKRLKLKAERKKTEQK